MDAKWLWPVVVVIGLSFVLPSHPLLAQPGKNLTVLYSNNLNGEIDPCPS